MPISYEIDPASNIATVRLVGDVTTADFQRYFPPTHADPAFTATMHRLVFTDEVTSFPTTADIRTITDGTRGRTENPCVRFAIVANAPLGRGMMAIVLGLSGMVDRYAFFPDATSATKWLIAPGAKCD